MLHVKILQLANFRLLLVQRTADFVPIPYVESMTAINRLPVYPDEGNSNFPEGCPMHSEMVFAEPRCSDRQQRGLLLCRKKFPAEVERLNNKRTISDSCRLIPQVAVGDPSRTL